MFASETPSPARAYPASSEDLSWDPRGVPRVNLLPHGFGQVPRGRKLPTLVLKSRRDFSFPALRGNTQIKASPVDA